MNCNPIEVCVFIRPLHGASPVLEIDPKLKNKTMKATIRMNNKMVPVFIYAFFKRLTFRFRGGPRSGQSGATGCYVLLWSAFFHSLASRLACERRGHQAANNRRDLVNEFVVLKSCHHKKGKVYAAREVALEDRVAHMSTPQR